MAEYIAVNQSRHIAVRVFALLNIAFVTAIVMLMTSSEYVEPAVQLVGFVGLFGTVILWTNTFTAMYRDDLFFFIQNLIVSGNGAYFMTACVGIVYAVTQGMSLHYGNNTSGLAVFSQRFGGNTVAITILIGIAFLSLWLAVRYRTQTALSLSSMFALYATIIVFEISQGNFGMTAWTAVGYLGGLTIFSSMVIVLVEAVKTLDIKLFNAETAVDKSRMVIQEQQRTIQRQHNEIQRLKGGKGWQPEAGIVRR
ncbi:MAG: hypothetical protein ACPG7F_16765 [Aggregatilineales bacterium]